MVTEEKLDSIYKELISVYQNIKAEVLIAEVEEKSDLKLEDIIINHKSTFKRSYRRDIININNFIDSTLTINLARNGIYDYLPEGLFHVEKENQRNDSYAQRRKNYKEQEKNARTFFSPFENEFFNQRLQIEKNERELLNNFYNLKDDFLIDFWKIDKSLPRAYILKLVKLLPYRHKIVGDLELTRLCLEKILDEKVIFKKTFGNSPSNKIKKSRNKYKLGVDLVLNNDNEVLQPLLDVIIGPISNQIIDNYLKKDGISKFVNTFYDYFIPIEIEVTSKFIVNRENGFLLKKGNSPIMGISTKL
ncbi:MAG: hypothetical protein L3J23_03345 [Flavobacteriaceae bacterium]|nr:hypothetical protein [Flavobacteriaceae bacterium]